ncbi:hypothetical protein [Undibacterium sp. TC9W]|uniref:hypothetical protein n=1 Tax=Undibacterium sp. TC9W TaxID=3413053 RepID=UPI003BEF5DEB
MDINLFISQLGMSVLTPSVITLFAGISVDLSNDLNLPMDEFDCYVEQPDDGICFVFTDEAMFLGKDKQVLGSGPLYFSGIFLYAEGKDNYSQFRGVIPFGISFTDKHEELVSLMGVPTWQRMRNDGSVAADRWDNVAANQIHISYSANDGQVVLVSLQKPNFA